MKSSPGYAALNFSVGAFDLIFGLFMMAGAVIGKPGVVVGMLAFGMGMVLAVIGGIQLYVAKKYLG